MQTLNLKHIIEKFKLEILSGEDKIKTEIKVAGLNRAGLELSGYFEKGAKTRRVIFMSTKENGYISQFDETIRKEKYYNLISQGCPAIIITPKFNDDLLINIAKEKNFPILKTDEKETGIIFKKLLEFMDQFFAEQIEMHATLLQIFGKGVLLIGESGIGKSEIALELINSNHLFVGDDRIVLTKVGENIIGKCHPILINLVEVRGVGIIDVSKTKGYQSLIDSTKIDLILEMVQFKKDGVDDSDRLGNEFDYQTILNTEIKHIKIPVSSGRNIANIVETAVIKLKISQTDEYVDPTTLFTKRIEKYNS